jgi:hypothetical protein
MKKVKSVLASMIFVLLAIGVNAQVKTKATFEEVDFSYEDKKIIYHEAKDHIARNLAMIATSSINGELQYVSEMIMAYLPESLLMTDEKMIEVSRLAKKYNITIKIVKKEKMTWQQYIEMISA